MLRSWLCLADVKLFKETTRVLTRCTWFNHYGLETGSFLVVFLHVMGGWIDGGLPCTSESHEIVTISFPLYWNTTKLAMQRHAVRHYSSRVGVALHGPMRFLYFLPWIDRMHRDADLPSTAATSDLVQDVFLKPA